MEGKMEKMKPEELRRILKQKKMTLQELAEKIGISTSTVWRWSKKEVKRSKAMEKALRASLNM